MTEIADHHPELVIPDRAIRYILFQRTHYLRLPVTYLYRHIGQHLPVALPLYNVAVAIESRLDRGRVKCLYQLDMHREYRSIKQFLPLTCSTILDIGCGVAGIDILLDRHYAAQQPDIYLLDRTHVERGVFYLFKARAAFYNSLDVARELLVDNGIDEKRLHLLEANDRYEIAVDRDLDLVISLLSWGFHYPVATYCEQVHRLLKDDGVVILDVRKGTDGLEVLRQRFRHIEVIAETAKQFRVAAAK